LNNARLRSRQDFEHLDATASRRQSRDPDELYELVHVKWLERTSEVPFDNASVGILLIV
jgi:hypothetical protein